MCLRKTNLELNWTQRTNTSDCIPLCFCMWSECVLFCFSPLSFSRRQILSAWVKTQKSWCRCQRRWNRSCPQDLRLSSSGQRKMDSNPSLPTPTPLLPTTSNCASENKARAVTEDMKSINLKWLHYAKLVNMS